MVMTSLWTYRIFRSAETYKDLPQLLDGISFKHEHRHVSVTVGEVPDEILGAKCSALYFLGRLSDPKKVESDYSAPDDWRTKGRIYVCIKVEERSDISVGSGKDESEDWWFDFDSARRAADSSREARNRTLDLATGVLAGLLGPEILSEFIEESGILVRCGPNVSRPIPLFSVGQARVSVQKPFESLDLGDLKSVQSYFPKSGKSPASSIGRWISLVLGERDPFKRLMWAYAGIDMCVNKVLGSIRGDIAERIRFEDEGGSILSGLAVRELIWPLPSDSSGNPARDPDRGIIFKFAAVALTFFPKTANEDIEKFKEVNKYRNGVHGTGEFDADGPVEVAVELFVRYAPEVIRRLTGMDRSEPA